MSYTHTGDARFSPQDSHFNEHSSRRMLEKSRKHLKRLTDRNYDHKSFISLPSMQEFWNREGYSLGKFLAEVSSGNFSDKLELIRTTSLRILTALVLTEWHAKNSVRNFCTTFCKIFPNETEPSWSDELLLGPDGLPRLELPHLSQDEKKSLSNALYTVSVPVLQKSKERKRYSPKIILPILNPTREKKELEVLGEGAYGKVCKVKIAAGCLLIKDKASNRIEGNRADETFAWKQMGSVAGGQTELNFARDYYNSSRKSSFILDHLAIIEQGEGHASILYPLAQGDLQALLDGGLQCGDWPTDDPKTFHKIIQKCKDLADGLEFLHNDVKNGGVCSCRHGDLKPNNLLIFDEDWKIGDMGLAKVKRRSNNEPGVKFTTKTSRISGCATYRAPEMSVLGAYVGRATDVWALAAIMMEFIIWGFGGPKACKEFVEQRREYSNGFFYDKDVLSKAVDDELASWPKKHIEAVARSLQGDQNSARRLLDDLVGGLHKALIIEAKRRAESGDLLSTFENILKYFSAPKSVDVVRRSLQQLTLNEPSATTALTVLLNKHFEHDLFRQPLQPPREHTYVTQDTEWVINKWITQRTPTAIAIGSNEEKQRLPISTITHEIYYTARHAGYKVIKFLTLGRYVHHSQPLEPSLDLVYCFIQQFLDSWGVKEYDADQLAMHDPAVSDEMKFKSAVAFLGSLIQTYGQDRSKRPLIVIIDEFWQVFPAGASETANEQWRSLLAMLGCGHMQERNLTNAASFSQSSHLKILIRAKGYLQSLKDLGFKGTIYYPLAPKRSGQTLRRIVASSLKKHDENARISTS